MKIDGMNKPLAALKQQQLVVEHAATEATQALGEAQRNVANAQTDAVDKGQRKSEPMLGGLLKRVESFDSAYTRIKQAREGELRQAEKVANASGGMYWALANLVNSAHALSPKAARDLNVFDAMRDLGTAMTLFTSIDQLKRAIVAAGDSPVAQAFPSAQLDALADMVRQGIDELTAAHPNAASGMLAVGDLVDTSAKGFVDVLTGALANMQSPTYNKAMERQARISSGLQSGPQYEDHAAAWKRSALQVPPLDYLLRGAATQANRPLNVEETARALLSQMPTPQARDFVLAALHESGHADLVGKLWPIDVARDVDSTAYQLVATLRTYDAPAVDGALREAFAKHGVTRLGLDDVIKALSHVEMNDNAVVALDSLVMQNPVAYRAFLPPKIGAALVAMQDMQHMALPSTLDAAGELNKLKNVMTSRDEELVAKLRRQQAEGNVDGTALRAEGAESFAAFERGITELQRALPDALKSVAADANALRERIGDVVGRAREVIEQSAGGPTQARTKPRFVALLNTVDQYDGYYRGQCDQLEQSALTQLTQTLVGVPATRSAVAQGHARVMQQIPDRTEQA